MSTTNRFCRSSVDIEGNELNLLKGANKVLSEGNIEISVDVHAPITTNNPIHIYLRDLGYEVSMIRRRFVGLYPTRIISTLSNTKYVAYHSETGII